MSWTVECTAPYIIGVHTNTYSKLHRRQLEDVVIVDLDKNVIHSSFDDLNQFPKNLLKKMKHEIEDNLSMTGDHIARGFLRIMAVIFGERERKKRFSRYLIVVLINRKLCEWFCDKKR